MSSSQKMDPAGFSKKDSLANLAKFAKNRAPRVLRVHWSEVYSVDQVRKNFRDIDKLADSIREHEQENPVRVFKKDEKGYRIRRGERRWRACKLLDSEIDIIVDDRNPHDEAMEVITQIVENVQRDDLTPKELADAFGFLRNEGMKQKDIAEQAAMTEAQVSKHLALLRTPDYIVELLEEGYTRDLELANVLRQVAELDEQRARQLCAQAMDEGITRAFAQGILRGIRQERSDIDRENAKPKQEGKLDDPGAIADQDHERELNEAGLNETGLDEGGEGGLTLPPEDDPEPSKSSGQTPEPSTPKQKESALKTPDGFYERKPEDAVLLCEFDDDGEKRTGVIQLNLLADDDHKLVVRKTNEDGSEELVVVSAPLVKLIGYRQ